MHPPPRLVLVLRALALSRVLDSVPWLRLARHLVVVFDASDEPAPDPELRELVDLELQELRDQLGNVVAVLRVQGDRDATIVRALQQLQALPDGPWPLWTPALPRPAGPSGPWLPWSPPRWNTAYPPDPDHALRSLAAHLHVHDGVPCWLDPDRGERLDLLGGERTPVPEARVVGDTYRPAAVTPDGTAWLTSVREGLRTTFRLGERTATGGWGRAIGIDPSGRVAWAGGRCIYHWRLLLDGVPALWMPYSHDWPCGHGKKLYGFEDNDPLWVHLAPDASACLSVYEHDALVTPGLPLHWRDLGSHVVGERSRGEPRALLYEHSEADDAYPADPSVGDEDARDRAPVVTLGPSDALRYVVGLEGPTWRLRGEVGERLGSGGGWVVYDAGHTPVHRGTGRLLAGWDRWVVVLEDGQLRREDLVDGRGTGLGPAQRPVLGAVALPGTPHVVLLALEGAEGWVRLL